MKISLIDLSLSTFRQIFCPHTWNDMEKTQNHQFFALQRIKKHKQVSHSELYHTSLLSFLNFIATSKMPRTANQVAVHLQRQMEEDQANVAASSNRFGSLARHVEDDSPDTSSPLFEEYIAVDGDDTLVVMTNFTTNEFDTRWRIVETEMTIAWTQG